MAKHVLQTAVIRKWVWYIVALDMKGCGLPLHKVTDIPFHFQGENLTILYQRFTNVFYISGYTFYLALIFDGYDKYEDITDFKLELVTEVPEFDFWNEIKSHESGDILRIQVRSGYI